MKAIGVREFAALLSGRASMEEALTKAKTETRRYAKRQMTWARRFMQDWEWVPDADTAIATVEAKLLTP
jgi:tRNA dimethylallyltransferase